MQNTFVPIEILYHVVRYGSEASVECKVRYPTPDGPITVDYSDNAGDDPELAWKLAHSDIQSYVDDPRGWISHYHRWRTTDKGKRLEEMKCRLAQFEDDIEKGKRSIEANSVLAEDLRTKIAEMEQESRENSNMPGG